MTGVQEKSLAGKFTHFLVNHPWKSMGLGLLLFSLALPGMSKLGFDFSYRIWFQNDDPLIETFDIFERRFGSDDNVMVVMHSPSGIFDVESANMLRDLTTDLWQVPDSIRVDSLANFNWVHAEGDELLVDPFIPDEGELTPTLLEERRKTALAHETLPNYLVSQDTKTASFFVRLKPSIDGSLDYDRIMKGTREILSKYEGQGDHVFHITGNAAVTNGFKETTQKDFKNLFPIIVGLTVLFLAIAFRGLGGIGLAMTVVISAILMTVGTSGWAGIKINNLTSIVPQILVAIGIADAVHLLSSFFRYRAAGLDRVQAARESGIKNFIPTILTSVSTGIGFFSFGTSKIVPIAELGILAGIGTIYAWFITYLLMVPMMAKIPVKIRQKKQLAPNEVSQRSRAFTAGLSRFSTPIIATFGLITVGSIYLGSQAEVNSDPFKYFAPSYPLTIANQFYEDNVGGSMAMEMVVEAGQEEGIKDPAFLRKVDQFQSWLQEKPYISRVVSINDILKSMNRSLHAEKQTYYRIPETREGVGQQLFLYTSSLPQGMDINDRIAVKNDAVRLTVMWDVHDSKRSLTYFDEFETKAKEMGLTAYVTGKMPLYQNMIVYIAKTFVVSVSIALVLISLVLCWVFGSVKLGMIALIPNTIPLIFGAAMIKILGIYVDVGTVIVGSICLGIAVDDTIHFMANYARLVNHGKTPQEATAEIMSHTAPALIVTTLVLVAAFGTFIFASFVPNYNFGRLVALILTFALLLDLTFLPALLMRIGHVNSIKGVDLDEEDALPDGAPA